MSTIGAYEAKTKFSELLERVENGERVTITKHGRPVAEIVPAKRRDPVKVGEAFDRLRNLAREVNINMSWEDLKKYRDEGKR